MRDFTLAKADFISCQEDSFFEREGRWGSFLLPGTHDSKKDRLEHLQNTHDKVSAALTDGKYLVLTFGTAIGFHHLQLDQIVANCHKFPGQDFERHITPLGQLYSFARESLAQIFALNPDLKVLLTVSPVRHIRSGLENNSVSKALLRALCHHLVSVFPAVGYFPSYEIMMDDLRDYRFYRSDLIHPNEMAVDYIWEKLANGYFSEGTRELLQQIGQVMRDLAHRPINPRSEGHKRFLVQLEKKISQLSGQVDLTGEWAQLRDLKAEAGLEL